MPAMLKIFISYASEDQRLVDVIVGALNVQLRHAISLTYMSRFEPGVDYRLEIDRKLDGADILLVVASGKLKLAHSFCGYEVGYFRKSQQGRPYIREAPRPLPRIILPIAVLTDLPDTVSEIQGVQLPRENQLFVHFDPKGGAVSGAYQVIYKLLIRMDDIVQDLSEETRSADEGAKIHDDIKSAATLFAERFNEALRTIPVDQQLPRIKFTVSLPNIWERHKHELRQIMTVTVHGPTGKLFSSEPKETCGPWLQFQDLLGEKNLALSWTDAIESLVTCCLGEDDFSNDDQLVLSHDESKVYRLFVSKCTLYYDKSREIDIYVIPILHASDAGDPFTTYLAKAMSITLRYRSLFLEGGSPYALGIFKFIRDTDLHRTIRGMLKELRVLLVTSREARLSTPKHLAELFGTGDASVRWVSDMVRVWEDIKADLITTAEKVLVKPSHETEMEFIAKLEVFCRELDKMNRHYLKQTIVRLNDVVGQGEGG